VYAELQGNGIVAFSDPAGAKACLALTDILQRKYPKQKIKLFSNKQYDFYKDWNISVSCVESIPKDVFTDDVDWVFTATSHPESSDCFELGALEVAKDAMISCWSFVDHWSCMVERFTRLDHSLIFPDTILVIDDLAYKKAIEAGLPPHLLRKTINPYLDYIRNIWIPKKTSDMIRIQYKVAPNEKILLFAPDPISLREESKAWGYDESDVLQEILKVIRGTEWKLFVKLHPLQSRTSMFARLTSEATSAFVIAEDVNNLDLMAAADMVIGFYSNFLLEADALSIPIIRYKVPPHLDLFAHLNLGTRIANSEDLENFLKQYSKL
jgi:hypothetical protein